ncbi:hypothetical protein BH23GEM5_BH23GEM5_08660 [soil metagenome]
MRSASLIFGILLAVVLPSAASGQAATPAVVPFGAGERANYQVRLGGVIVGRGSMEVLGIRTVDGRPTYHTRFRVAGGVPLARVDDTFESWIDVVGLFSRRFMQDQKEVRFQRRRAFDFFPERRIFRRTDESGETGTLPTDQPLDDVSFLYYARTLPLRVGETYTLNRYFKESGNPVVLQVLRRETVRVPAGTFQTVVVRPIIRTKGLFSQGGEAEVYFTDDARRILVQMRSKVPVVGSLTLHLQDYRAGQAYSSPR